MSVALVLTAALATGCASSGPLGGSEPGEQAAEALQRIDGIGYELVAIAGLNDLHGGLSENTSWLAAQLLAARKKFGTRLLILDSGDYLHGDPMSDIDEGFQITAILNRIGIDASAVAEHDFAFGALGADTVYKQGGDPLGTLRARMAEAQFPLVGTNLETDDSDFGVKKSVVLRAGSARIGVLAVVHPSHLPYAGPAALAGVTWRDPKTAILSEADRLRKEESVDAIVLLAHLSQTCPSLKKKQREYAPSDPQPECDSRASLAGLLRSLPLGTVDAVVAGHEHQRIHHWISGVPVIQSRPFGGEFAMTFLTIDTSKHAVLTERTRIEAPISARQPRFLGQAVTPDLDTRRILEPLFARRASVVTESLATFAEPIVASPRPGSPHTPQLGWLAAEAVRSETDADVAILPAGFLDPDAASAWPVAGLFTRDRLEELVPFDVALAQVSLSPERFRELAEIAFNGARAEPWIAGFKVLLLPPHQDLIVHDFNQDQRIEHWETTRVREITSPALAPSDGRIRVTLPLPVPLGAEDFGPWFGTHSKELPSAPALIEAARGLSVRQALAGFLKKSQIPGASAPAAEAFVREDRVELAKAPSKKKKSRRRRR